MKANKIIVNLLEKNGITYEELGVALGYEKQPISSVWNILKNPRYKIKLTTMIDMLTACGYKLVAVPLSTNVKEAWYLVEKPDNSREDDEE